MIKTEFLALEFGSVVFNKDGVKGVVINTFHDDDISVCFDTATGSDRIRLVRFGEADTLFLEKPKKKVVKELKGYIFLSALEEAHNLKGGRHNKMLFSKELVDDMEDTLVTITYETEE